MQDYRKIGTELIEQLASDPLNAPVLWMLHMKFIVPAMMLDMTDELGGILTHYSLNGIRSGNLCKPYRSKKF
jgi:hypothetical protein